MGDNPTRLHGIVGDSLTAKTEGGATIKLTETLESTDYQGSKHPVALARKALVGQWARQDGTLRQHMREATATLNRSIPSNQTELSPTARARIKREVEEQLRTSVRQAGDSIGRNLAEATTRDLRAQAEHLRRLGLPPPSAEQLKRLAEATAARTLATPFPGTGKTTADRLGALGARAQQRLDRVVDADPKKRARDMQRARANLHDVKPGTTKGGSVAKDLSRINRTEQSRSARDATIALGKEIGLEFAYWRLSANHRHRGGDEICEKLSEGYGPDVVERLRELGADARGVNLSGLYTRENYPEVPHPNCMCFPELWHPPSAMAHLLIDRLTDDGTIPEDVLPMSQIPQEATSALNDFADRMGFRSTINQSNVEGIGVKAMSQILTSQLSGADKRIARRIALDMQRDYLPKVQDQIAKARDLRDRLVREIDSNSLLAPETKASQVAELRTRYARTLQGAQASVAVLQSLTWSLQNPTADIVTARTPHADAVLQNLAAIGMVPDQHFRITKDGGHFAGRITQKQARSFDYLQTLSKNERVAAIKEMRLVSGAPRGLQTHIPWQSEEFPRGRPIDIRKDQQAGVRFIEEQQSALLHFGAGLGKTPLVISSISDLAAKGNITSGAIATPSALRTQMVQEIMSFNADGKIALYVSPGQVSATDRSVRAQIRNTVLDRVPTITDADGLLRPDPKRVPKDYADALEAEITKREGRVVVKGVSKNSEVRARRFAEDRANGVLYTVIGHDDLAVSAREARKTFDYLAIDEIHQMTSQSTTGGSFKANQLGEIQGGRLKYRVGLTGTASRNNMGELWDVANWLRPGQFGDKAEFDRQFSQQALQTDALNDAQIKALRQRIDPFTYTRASPVTAKLNNAFSERQPDGTVRTQAERDRYLRKLNMTPEQEQRARRIEEEFQRAKERQSRLTPEERGRLQSEFAADRKALHTLLKDRGLLKYADEADLERIMNRREVPSAERGQILALREKVKATSQTLAPETWRDNEHHKALHGGDWRTNAKAQEAVRLVTGELAGRRPIIHVERIESLDMMRAALEAQGLKVGQYDGSMTVKARDDVKARFNGGTMDALLVTRAGSTGLNLQKASTATIHFDTPWTYAEYLQREARNWRTGQEHAVDSYVLTHSDALTDRRRLELMRKKGDQLAAIDELSKVHDRGNPRELGPVQDAVLAKSWSQVEEQQGAKRARDLQASIERQLDAAILASKPVNQNAPVGSLVPRDSSLRQFLNQYDASDPSTDWWSWVGSRDDG